MYDNIDFILSKESCKDVNFLKDTPKHLTAITNSGFGQFGDYVNGYLDSLKVSITEKRVKIANSSLCKYYLKDNFKTLTKGDTKRAIEKISDSLHLPFNQSDVCRIDAARNLVLKYDEKIYYPFLGEAQFYSRLEQNNGLYYNNSLRQLVFYGKEYEQKIKGQPVPEIYKNRHTLRFEIRFRKQLKKQFKQAEIKAETLYDERFYYGLVKRWRDEYLSIQKINTKLQIMKPTGSKKDFAENLALFTILELGQPQILNKIKEWQISGQISKKQAYDLRAFVRDVSKTPIDSNGNELINELDKKIKESARYC